MKTVERELRKLGVSGKIATASDTLGSTDGYWYSTTLPEPLVFIFEMFSCCGETVYAGPIRSVSEIPIAQQFNNWLCTNHECKDTGKSHLLLIKDWSETARWLEEADADIDDSVSQEADTKGGDSS